MRCWTAQEERERCGVPLSRSPREELGAAARAACVTALGYVHVARERLSHLWRRRVCVRASPRRSQQEYREAVSKGAMTRCALPHLHRAHVPHSELQVFASLRKAGLAWAPPARTASLVTPLQRSGRWCVAAAAAVAPDECHHVARHLAHVAVRPRRHVPYSDCVVSRACAGKPKPKVMMPAVYSVWTFCDPRQGSGSEVRSQRLHAPSTAHGAGAAVSARCQRRRERA